jgi:MFS family permease
VLGMSAAVFGTAVERRGPRWAMSVAATCFCGGLIVAAGAAAIGQMWLIIVGYGVIGGVGLGIGYISPVSTLMKWFPDRPGMATGFAIMGFGGGALIASPWSSQLMKWFGTDRHGLAATFLAMGVVYAVLMTMGILLVRLPPPEWEPPVVRAAAPKLPHAAGPDRTANEAIKTPQFWLLWVVLCFNVTAGIGILERAAPIYRDYFPRAASPAALTAAAAGFVAMLSLANSLGRIIWSSASDAAGRKNMYRLYLGLGAVLYLVLIVAQNASKPLFLVVCILLLSFYGAGFATVPAYLRDLFGYLEVGAIHGRLLTAWSTAGVLGPVIVNAIADNRIAAGVVGPDRYRWSFAIMVILLLIALVCNELIRTPRPPSSVAAEANTRKPASVTSGGGS